MDIWDKLQREDRCRNRKQNPSFSSTLLDAIYRSIDESNVNGSKGGEEVILYEKASMRKKNYNKEGEIKSLQRVCMIEKWMEKKSMADSERNSNLDGMLLKSSSSSSDCSCGGGFSSSESDSFSGAKSRTSSSSLSQSYRPKPIKTSISAGPQQRFHDQAEHEFHFQKPKQKGGFVRTKSKAMKIYSDLKKVKQPMSPGGRLAAFLNSLFTAAKKQQAKTERKLKKSDQETSTCSSARSCLSKTPSSAGNSKLNSNSNGTKRSVRFCPVSVILDEDSRPCGHKNIHYQNDHQPKNKEQIEIKIMEENRRVMEAAKNLLKSYHQKKKIEAYDHMRDICNNGNEASSDEDEEDEEDDAASYASSDLFELDNLSAIGIERYCEELPVYETTHLNTNRAIANGLFL